MTKKVPRNKAKLIFYSSSRAEVATVEVYRGNGLFAQYLSELIYLTMRHLPLDKRNIKVVILTPDGKTTPIKLIGAAHIERVKLALALSVWI